MLCKFKLNFKANYFVITAACRFCVPVVVKFFPLLLWLLVLVKALCVIGMAQLLKADVLSEYDVAVFAIYCRMIHLELAGGECVKYMSNGLHDHCIGCNYVEQLGPAVTMG